MVLASIKPKTTKRVLLVNFVLLVLNLLARQLLAVHVVQVNTKTRTPKRMLVAKIGQNVPKVNMVLEHQLHLPIANARIAIRVNIKIRIIMKMILVNFVLLVLNLLARQLLAVPVILANTKPRTLKCLLVVNFVPLDLNLH